MTPGFIFDVAAHVGALVIFIVAVRRITAEA